jgi:hypothetical protein
MVCSAWASAVASTPAVASLTVPTLSPPPQPLIARTMADNEKKPDLKTRIFISNSANNESGYHQRSI